MKIMQSRRAASSCSALIALTIVALLVPGRTLRGEQAKFDRNAVFVGANGKPVYLVVDMRPSSFLGVPAVIGVWTDGRRRLPFAAIPSNNPQRWVWLTSGGPAGVIEFHPGQQPPVTWKDNAGNSGPIVTY